MDWFRSKKNVTLTVSVVGLVLVIGSIIYSIWADKKKIEYLEKANAALVTQRQEIDSIRRGVRNLELSQCAAPHVNNGIKALLGCPEPPPQQQTQAVENVPVQGATAQPFDAQLPNYGFFGAFDQQQGAGMPAFY